MLTREELTTENHSLRAKLVDAERELERRDKVIAKLALRCDALEEHASHGPNGASLGRTA